MKRITALFIALASVALAVNAKFECTFAPPVDVARGEPGVEYIVEERMPDGSWRECARGAGVNTSGSDTELSIFYSSNVNWGTYEVRVTMVKPTVSPPSVSATTDVSPGAPGNPKVRRK